MIGLIQEEQCVINDPLFVLLKKSVGEGDL